MNKIIISKSNFLGAVYRYWKHLGGKGREPEDLCHFMRVCFIWTLARWLFSDTHAKMVWVEEWQEERRITSNRFPRFVFFLVEGVLILLVTELISDGVLLTTFLRFIAFMVAITVIVGFFYGTKFFGGKALNTEAVRTVGAYLVARKQRICPFIELEK